MTTGRSTETAPELRFAEAEHRELTRGIARLAEVGDLIGHAASEEVIRAVDHVVGWLRTTLVPHAEWEDAWLYPEFDRIAGTPWATKLMHYEHHQIAARIDRLAGQTVRLREEPSQRRLLDLRADLAELHGLIAAHIEREERFLLPLLSEDAAIDTRG